MLLVDACQSGVGVADLAVHAGMEIAEAGARVQLLTATFDQAARNGCFTRTLHELLRDGLADLSSDYLLAATVAARIADACRQQEQPRLAAPQGRWQISDPGLWLARNVRAPGQWVLAGTGAGAQVERLLAAWHSARLVTLVGGAGTGKSALAAALTRPELAPGIVFPGLVDALAFASVSPTAAEIAAALAAQLGRPGGPGAPGRVDPAGGRAAARAAGDRGAAAMADRGRARPARRRRPRRGARRGAGAGQRAAAVRSPDAADRAVGGPGRPGAARRRWSASAPLPPRSCTAT